MSDADAAGAQAPSPNLTALVDALDARARAAGTEGATTVLRGMVGSVSETMGSIEDRLERLEQRLAAGGGMAGGGAGGGDTAIAEAVQSALATFNSRLGRLEEAFVQAVEESGSGTEQVVDQIREAVVSAMASLPPPAPIQTDGEQGTSVDLTAAFAPVLTRLESLEIAVRKPSPVAPVPPPPPPPDLAGAVAPLASLLHRIDTAVQQLLDEPLAEPVPDVGVALAPFVERLERLEGAVRALADAPLPESPRPIEFPPPPDLDAAIAPVLGRLERLEGAVRALADAPPPEPPPSIEFPPPPDLDAAIAPVLGRLDALAKQSEAPPAAGPLNHEPVLDALRKEAELLTQRVAALAVGVEATRAMLEQHVADTEDSLGRKATEVGRRLAADLGIGRKKSRWRRERELGPG